MSGKEPNVKRVHDRETEEKINGQLDSLLSKARAEKAKVSGANNERWRRLYDMYEGGKRHWRGYTGNIPVSSRIAYNLIRRNVEIKLALL